MGEIDSNKMKAWDYNIPFTSMDRSSTWEVNEETMALNDTLDKMESVHIYSTLKKKTEHTFKCTWNILRIDHLLSHKPSLNKFWKNEITPSIFSDHNI